MSNDTSNNFSGSPSPHSTKDSELILTSAQMRMADQLTKEKGISAAELMERAGAAIAHAVIACNRDGGRIVVVAGPGNNGGDGFVAARILRKRNIPVTAIPIIAETSITGDAAVMMEQARQAGVKIRPATSREELEKLNFWLSRSAVVVDAMFGTGLSRNLEGWFADVVAAINESDRDVFAVDIPSGIHGDDGSILGVAVQADFTLPIAAYKWGHWLNAGHDYAGTILSPAAIGISEEILMDAQNSSGSMAGYARLIDHVMVKRAFPPRREQSHKGDYGHLWIFGGSQGYTGAPRLAASGAQAIATGLVSIASPAESYAVIAAASLEVMVHPQEQAPWHGADAVVAGPGWGKEQVPLLTQLLDSDLPLLLDADALNMLADSTDLAAMVSARTAITVLTPHPGEAGRLLGSDSGHVQQDRLASALALVERYHTWVVLKGAQTLVVSPHRHLWLSPFGSPKLAVAGTGDVLSGMIGGLLARGIEPEHALPAAVGLHALAGEECGWHRAGHMESIIARLICEFDQ